MQQLGAFFWYSIPQEMRSVEEIRRVWRKNGLDVELLPKSRKPADVAAEACTIVDRTAGSPSFVQVENSSQQLLYTASSLTGEVEVVFDKRTGEFVCLDETLLRHVRSVYEHNSSRLPSHKQRQALRAFVLAAGAENLHGSIYFMPALGDGLEKLNSAWRMVFALYGEEAEFHVIPVDATALQVGYVKAAFDHLLEGEILALTAEVRKMTETDPHRKWRSDRLETLQRSQQALEARGDRFAELLGEPPARAFAAARQMDEVISALVEQATPPVIS